MLFLFIASTTYIVLCVIYGNISVENLKNGNIAYLKQKHVTLLLFSKIVGIGFLNVFKIVL